MNDHGFPTLKVGRCALLLFAILIAGSVGSSPVVFSQTSSPSKTDIPHTLSYQGILHSNGQVVRGDQFMTVRLYSDEAGTQLLWEDTFTAPVGENGEFSLQLGSQKPLPQLSSAVWLSTAIGSGVELRPLTPLSASPYALAIADGSVTASKMATDYVQSISINGQKVSGRGADLNFVTGDGIDMSFDNATNSVLLRSSKNTFGASKGAAAQGGQDTVKIEKVGESGHKTGFLEFEQASNSNSTTVTATATSVDRIYTIPDAGSDASFVLTAGTQSIGGSKTFTSALSMSGNAIQNVANPSSAQDAATKYYVDAATTALNSAINTEVANRTAADNAEANARASADAMEVSARTAAIASEAAARSVADAAEVTARNAAISAEAAARTAADAAEANARIASDNAETSSRQSADIAETTARQSADVALSAGLNNEVNRATGEEATLRGSINSEIANRQLADQGLQNQINTKAADATVMHLSGNESVDGSKIFTEPIIADITGNAGSVTNGIYTNSVYDNPDWISSISSDKIIGTFPISQIENLTSTLNSKAADNTVVHRTGNEMISGTKSFSSTIVGNITGNAGTATNGVVTTGSYSNPTWITTLASSKISGSFPESQVTNLTSDLASKQTVILKGNGSLNGLSGTVDITVNGATSGDYVIVTRTAFASGLGHFTGNVIANAGTDKVTVRSDQLTDNGSFQVMVVK